MVALSGKSAYAISVELGHDEGWLGAIIRGRSLMKTNNLAQLCNYFRCSPDELIEFHGFDISEKYKDFEFQFPREPKGVVTYRPLLEIFYDTYTERGEDWKEKLNIFFDKIEPLYNELATDSQKKGFEEARERARANVTSGRSNNRPGLSSVYRTRIRTDKDMKIIHIYDICKALRCPIGRVMGYK